MHKHSSPGRQATGRSAASGLRHLLDEVQVFTAALPDFHDAFDADDLPLGFILRRDSQADAGARPPDTEAPRASRVGQPPTRAVHVRRRGGHRRGMSDD